MIYLTPIEFIAEDRIVKTTSCDSVALTTDLYACLIETKEERSPSRELEQLVLALATSAKTTVSDEQILSLP